MKHGLKTAFKNGLVLLSPSAASGSWCSRRERRPNVSLIWCGNDQVRKRAQTLDTETAIGVLLMRY